MKYLNYIMVLYFSDGSYETKGYAPLGCWKFADLPSLEQKEEILNGNYKNRSDAFHKCFTASRKDYMAVFALTDGGSCQSLSYRSQSEYIKQGRSTKCAQDGKGGPDGSQMYRHIG